MLIRRMTEEDALFSGKNANSNEGWKKVSASLPMNKDWMCCKSQWNALVKKYKSFFRYKTGEGTGEEAVAEEAKDWQYFDAMHEYASQKDNYHPPYLLDSGEGEVSMREKSPTPFSSSAAPSTSRSSTSRSRSGTPQLRNRDERFQRLEQHIIRRDHKFKRRVGSLLAVFGQMVQTDYPHINVDSLLVSSESDSD
ncbi:uncharacterized protein LOC118741624 [Rhagoletis pomonella]|uniref:uncharacterized protein LOC118741624 n=1 Tax=Rhagoletis pomonella TaxID=28610 RepID=UPI001784434D|nr:uncharacterized protein LOC118741624 [Rhagoletis pomonella]